MDSQTSLPNLDGPAPQDADQASASSNVAVDVSGTSGLDGATDSGAKASYTAGEVEGRGFLVESDGQGRVADEGRPVVQVASPCIPSPVLPEYTDTFESQASMQYEEYVDPYNEHQHHAASFLQEVVGENPPALVHRNPCGPPHNPAEASQK